MILAILILGIMTSLAIPSLSTFKRERDLETAAQITSTACNYARSLAVTTGRRTRVNPIRDQSRFQLFVEEDPLTEPGSFKRRQWPMGLTGILPESIVIDQVFYPVVREGDSGYQLDTDSSVVFQTEEEALEEREDVLVFDPDGSTRDTFVYLKHGDPLSATGIASLSSQEQDEEVITVAIVGVIGTAVIVPYYTEEIFNIYEPRQEELP
jgi:Tfp pilus assembly protein FimT